MKNDRAEFREYVKSLLESFGGSKIFVDKQVNIIVRLAKTAYETDEFEALPEEVDAVYSAYPTRCVVQGRNLGKSSADKKKIARLLKDNSKEKLIKTIERYVEDCKRDKVYMKNFGTFLNNLPEYTFEEKPKVVEIGGYRDLRKITEAQ